MHDWLRNAPTKRWTRVQPRPQLGRFAQDAHGRGVVHEVVGGRQLLFGGVAFFAGAEVIVKDAMYARLMALVIVADLDSTKSAFSSRVLETRFGLASSASTTCS